MKAVQLLANYVRLLQFLLTLPFHVVYSMLKIDSFLNILPFCMETYGVLTLEESYRIEYCLILNDNRFWLHCNIDMIVNNCIASFLW